MADAARYLFPLFRCPSIMSTRAEDLLGGAVKASWRRFLDTYEPLRPELYRYCRHLTRSPWDAEDMAQETLSRAFVTLGMMTEPPHHPRACCFALPPTCGSTGLGVRGPLRLGSRGERTGDEHRTSGNP